MPIYFPCFDYLELIAIWFLAQGPLGMPTKGRKAGVQLPCFHSS
jgi:hypothetical protein